MSKLLRDFDPELVEVVEAALAPYRGKFSPDLIEHMREEALVLMSVHPYTVALLASSRSRPPTDESHEVPRGGATPAGGEENGRAVGAATGSAQAMNAVRAVEPPRLTPAQQELVAGVLGLIDGKVSEIAPHAQPWEREELRSWGRYGAVVAAGRFDPGLGTRFSTYAYTFIAGEIFDCLRRDGRERRLRRAVSWAARTFTAETSDRFDVIWDDEATNDGRLRTYARRLVAGMALGIAQAKDTLDDTAIDAEDRRQAVVIVREACAGMSEHERRLHTLRYVDDLPMKVVADQLGVSYATVRRHHEALLDRIAAALHAGGVTEMPPFE